MFSAKNYGLPKDLIEAAKKVHEKQLMEYDEDGHINNPPKGMDKGTKKDREKAAKMGLKGPHLEGEGKLPKKNKKLPPLPVRKPKNEEVQFTEEELAEAFAIFLEENFHVEMLTEEDLDYVFENEFPQWLEESAAAMRRKSREEQKKRAEEIRRERAEQAAREAEAQRNYRSRKDEILRARARAAAASKPTPPPPNPEMSGTLDDGGEESKTPISKIKKDIERARAEVNKSSTPAPPPTARNQVSARPASVPAKVAPPPSVRRQEVSKGSRGQSSYQQAKKAVRPTPGDSGRTATDRLKYMARRGNKASQKALRGPKKDWRSSVFNPDSN